MATTETFAMGDGTTTEFGFSFPYIKTEDVKVELQEYDATQTAGNQIISRQTITAFVVPSNNPTVVQFSSIGTATNYQAASGAPLANHATSGLTIRVRIYRFTDADSIPATFIQGSAIRAQDLNDNFEQNLYIMQERQNTIVSIQTGGIGENVISTNALQDDAVDASKLRDSVSDDTQRAVTTNHIRDNAVTSAKIANDTIVDEDVATSAGIAATKLSFTQSGTGATPRTVDSRLKDVISVKDFGAVGDDATDDAAAIQACFDYVSSLPAPTAAYTRGGTAIFFPAGTYKCLSPLIAPVRNNLTLFGEGGSSSIRGMHGGVTLTLGDANVQACVNCNILDLNFAGSNKAADTALKTQRTYNLTVSNCTFTSANTGYYHNSGVSDWIRGCSFRHLGNAFPNTGFNLRFDNVRTSTKVYGNSGVHILDCELMGAEAIDLQANIYVRHMDGIYIDNCHMYKANYGLWLDPDGVDNNGITSVMVSNTYFDTTGVNNIRLTGKTLDSGTSDTTAKLYNHMQFSNCYIRDAGNAAVFIDVDSTTDHPVHSLQFIGCQFRRSGIAAIYNISNKLVNYQIDSCVFDGCNIGGGGVSALLDSHASSVQFTNNQITDYRSLIASTSSSAVSLTTLDNCSIHVSDNLIDIPTTSKNPIVVSSIPDGGRVDIKDTNTTLSDVSIIERVNGGLVTASGGVNTLGNIPFQEGQSATIEYVFTSTVDNNPSGAYKTESSTIQVRRSVGSSTLTSTDVVPATSAGALNVTYSLVTSGTNLGFRVTNNHTADVRTTIAYRVIMHT